MANDQFDPEENEEAFEEAIAEHRQALLELLAEYAEENEVDQRVLVAVLVEIAMQYQMVEYCMSEEKPTSAGLQRELDSFRDQIGELVRETKKSAPEFVREMAAALEEADRSDGLGSKN